MSPIQLDMTGVAAIREGYGKAIRELAQKDPQLVAIDADLAVSTKSILVKEVAPERFLYSGISEQNTIGVACGLVLEGKNVFASSFAIFITGRAFEIIRQSVAFQNLPVKIVGSHAGLHTGEDGGSAQALEDLSLMRTLPNMNVIVPADFTEAYHATHFLGSFKQPCYLRTGRNKIPRIFDEQKFKFEFGKARVLNEGKHATIAATGTLVHQALLAAQLLEKKGVSVRVLNYSTIKPFDREPLLKAAAETGAILTAEDHQVTGGLGSAAAEVLAEEGVACRFKRIGMTSFGESGSPRALYEKYGLNDKALASSVEQLLKK